MMMHAIRGLLLAATLMTPAAVLAQTSAPDAADGVEEITVTARKIEEKLSSAPISVSAISDKSIANLGLNSINDFAQQASGISFSQAFGRSSDRPVIRGQSNVLANVQFGVETGAAYFVDGVYWQGDLQSFDPEQLARVEIVKGPQSALYGRNTYAGAINFVTKDPTSEWSGNIRASAAEYGEYIASGSLSGPIIGDRLTFRVGGRVQEYGGQFTNQLTGRKVGDESTRVGYAMILAKPNDDLRIRLRGEYSEQNDGPLALFLQGSADNNCSPGFRSNFNRQAGVPFFGNIPATLGATPGAQNQNQYFCGPIQAQPNNVRLHTDPVQTPFGVRDGTAFDGVQNKQFNAQAVIDWDVAGSGWVVSSMTGYRDLLNRFGTDSDHSDAFFFLAPGPVPAATVEPAFANTNRKNFKDYSQEVRISSPQDKAVRVMVGGYYYKQTFNSRDITFTSGQDGEPLGTNLSSYATIENRAIFGLAAWDITERLTVQAEVRYQEETKTLIDRASAASIFCAGEQGSAAQFGFAGTCVAQGKWTGTDPRITVNYTTPGGTLLYAVYGQGRKPGGFNGTGGLLVGNPTYQEELVKGGEVGVKWTSPDRKLRVTAAAYLNELSAVQLTNAIPSTGAINSIVVNTGDARTKGFELELVAAPHPDITASVNASYVDARFTNGCDADFFQLNSGGLRVNFDTRNPPAAALPLCDITGKRLPLGSSVQVNGSLNWEPALSETVRLTTNVNFSYEDKKFIQTDNFAYVPEAFIVNARIGVRFKGIQIAGFVRNLTDEDAPPLATRWFDFRYGATGRNLPPAASVTFNGQPTAIETGGPRAFFTALRRGRTFGLETVMRF
ncbi:TonB-dependent receptor [Sandarakinorhabdus sp.]|jgi:iron complex outermembrane recepter protein|uniref:TonB-dependent receptor n=1 Tax=Sandarakinorhabdus sp. TaxID=1916663 RepID=UPI003342E140